MNYFVVYLLQCFIKALFIISLIKNALYYNNVVLFKIRLIVKFISFILNNHFFFCLYIVKKFFQHFIKHSSKSVVTIRL